MRQPPVLTQAFRDNGLKVTPQRQLLFRLLHDHHGHPSADSLFAEASEKMPGISLRTVYQTLNDLAAMGELRVINFAGGPARFDPNTGDHHHAECTSCGALRDVYVPSAQVPIADALDGLADFQSHHTHIVFSGICARCAESTITSTNNHSQPHDREYP
ncbi:MAG: Fur family transcriptional regulator [Actinomycetota bacterium]